MSLQHGIRANLESDREQRARFKQRVSNEAFGIYRPLTPESKEEVSTVLQLAANSVSSYLGINFPNSAPMKPLDFFGITFVQYTQVQKRLRGGLFHRGFEKGRMMDQIEKHTEEYPKLYVSLEEMGWYGARWEPRAGRKLAVRLDQNGIDYDVLERQSESVREMLRRSNGSELHVETPDHISLMKYGRYGDRLDLTRYQRRSIREIVEGHFEDAELTHIELGRLMMGEGYEKPIIESTRAES